MKEPVKKWVSKILLKMGGKGRGDQWKEKLRGSIKGGRIIF